MAQTVNNLEVKPDSYALGVSPTDWVDAKVLAANTAEAIAVPTGAKVAIFSCTTDFYARYNATAAGTAAAVPTDTSDGTACELNPTVRLLHGVAEISVIAEATAILTVRFCRG
jgi:hypothetical protein